MAVSPRNSEGSAKRTTKEIREWAIGEGREVSPRGRISAEIEQAFRDAQAKDVQAEAVPAKKTAAKKAPAAKKVAAKQAPAKTTAPKTTGAETIVAAKAPAKSAAAVGKAPAKATTKEIREWAIGEGREVSPRGRISAEIEQAFHEDQAKTAPARKVAAKSSAAKKAVAKKTVAKKAPAAKKVAAKKAPAKTTAPKTTGAETIVAAKAPAKSAAAVGKAPAKATTKEIREWAIGEGREVSPRGRISAEIEQAFHEDQAKTAPARNSTFALSGGSVTVRGGRP